MSVSYGVWFATLAAIVGLFLFDFFLHTRRPHEPSMREATHWTLFYVGLAILFGGGVWFFWGPQHGAEFFAGFVTEKSLSVDNLFVFVIIMSRFSVPGPVSAESAADWHCHSAGAAGLFIAAGAAAIERFSWVFISLVPSCSIPRSIWRGTLSAPRTMTRLPAQPDRAPGPQAVSRHHRIPWQPLLANVGGKRLATPLLFVVIALGFTDVMFALDSIPAIYGLTKAPYLVFTTNAFALLGLLQLYFLLGGLLDRLVYLGLGLSVILGFIGVKLVMDALHENTLPFINNGQPLHGMPEVPIWLSLSIIIGVLVITTVASLWRSRRLAARERA